MKNIRIEKTNNRTYVVKADTERFGIQSIMFESYSLEECKRYIGNEQYELVDKAIDEKTKKACELVKKVAGLPLNEVTFIYDDDDVKKVGNRVQAYYRLNKIVLRRDTDIEDIIHEIGHFIHERYLNNKQFRFSTSSKSKYAYTNYLENFAENFKDYVIGKVTDRTRKMNEIISAIV